MSYRCGIGAGMRKLGLEPGGPVIICDGCGLEYPVPPWPPKWFLDHKPPRGWRGLRKHDGTRRWDLCPGCWKGDK